MNFLKLCYIVYAVSGIVCTLVCIVNRKRAISDIEKESVYFNPDFIILLMCIVPFFNTLFAISGFYILVFDRKNNPNK